MNVPPHRGADAQQPRMADLLTDLEADDDLRFRFEIELLGQSRA
jgi:hypothetical protein